LALRAGAVGVALCAISWTFDARAAEPARLEWVRLEGAGSCIDSTELEARVKRRLGTDPFDPRASRSIEGVARRAGGVWRAQIAVRAHPSDANPPLRELESRADDCDALSNAAVLAVALAVDPAAAFSDPPPKETPPPPEPPKAPAAPPPVIAPSAGLAGRADLLALLQAGLLPHASVGVGLGAAAAFGQKLELGLRAAAFPEVQVSGDPSYAIGLTAFDLELCFIALRSTTFDLRACGGPSVGLLHAAVLAGDRAQPGERAWLAAELGLDAAFAVTRNLAFDLGVRVVAPVTRYHFILDGSDRALFDQSAVAGAAHAGLELRFGR
jgi:hypothetical protein